MTKKHLLRKKTLEKSKKLSEEVYDPFLNFEGTTIELYLAKFFYFIRKHSKIVFISFTLILLVVLAIMIAILYKQYLERKALQSFEELQKNPLFSAGAEDTKILIKKLDEYIKENSIDSSKRRAIIKKIEIYEQNNLLEEAAVEYEKLAKLVKEPEIKMNLLFRSAILFEKRKAYTRALSNVDEIFKQKFDDELILANVMFLQAILLDHIGKETESKKILENILNLKSEKYPELANLQKKVIYYSLFIKEEK